MHFGKVQLQHGLNLMTVGYLVLFVSCRIRGFDRAGRTLHRKQGWQRDQHTRKRVEIRLGYPHVIQQLDFPLMRAIRETFVDYHFHSMSGHHVGLHSPLKWGWVQPLLQRGRKILVYAFITPPRPPQLKNSPFAFAFEVLVCLLDERPDGLGPKWPGRWKCGATQCLEMRLQ